MHFDTKNWIKIYKMRVIYNEEDMINSNQVKKNKKKQGHHKISPKLGRNLLKLAKIGKIGIMCILTHKKL